MNSWHYNNWLGILIALGPLKVALIAWIASVNFEASVRRLAIRVAKAREEAGRQ